MSRSSIEQALTGLLPTLNGPLPPELIDLALSLLARSRSVAHSLKPDEEIARPYACAQLACERLKNRLNLPSITSRPPCPPRIYKKLHAYLTSALPAAASTNSSRSDPQTPSKKRTYDATTPGKDTPSRTPLSGRKTPRSSKKDEAAAQVPEWVMPAIRTLVKEFNMPAAAPNVYSGVESVLPLLARMTAATAETPSKRSSRTASTAQRTIVSDSKVLALIATLFLYVHTKMKDVDVTPEQYKEWRESTVESLLDTSHAKDTSYEELSAEIEDMLPLAQSEGWLGMEWFLNVGPLGGADNDGDEMEDVQATGRTNGKKAKRQGMSASLRSQGSDYIGLGTMMQDATDFLGDRRREEYAVWKQGIMKRIEEIEVR